MSQYILLTINLKGQISGMQKHIDKQVVTVDISPMDAKHPDFISRKILFTDRTPTECTRKLKISEEIVSEWERSECPYWEKPSLWKAMTKLQKVISNLKRYDEGYGISFDFIESK